MPGKRAGNSFDHQKIASILKKPVAKKNRFSTANNTKNACRWIKNEYYQVGGKLWL